MIEDVEVIVGQSSVSFCTASREEVTLFASHVSAIGLWLNRARGRGDSPTHHDGASERANDDRALKTERREWESPLAPVHF